MQNPKAFSKAKLSSSDTVYIRYPIQLLQQSSPIYVLYHDAIPSIYCFLLHVTQPLLASSVYQDNTRLNALFICQKDVAREQSSVQNIECIASPLRLCIYYRMWV
eukprot:655323_1